MLTNENNVAIASKYRFQRITPNYTLVYGEEEPKDAKCTEITANDISNLSREDFQWLEDANLILIREFADEHKEAQVKSFEKFLKELDKNVKEELKARDGERKESAIE